MARLLLSQPAGARVWQEIGGWNALSEAALIAQQQTHLQLLIQHAQSGAHGSPPKPPAPPVGLIEQRRREAHRVATHEQKALAYRAVADRPEFKAMIEERLASWGDLSKFTKGAELNRFANERMATWG